MTLVSRTAPRRLVRLTQHEHAEARLKGCRRAGAVDARCYLGACQPTGGIVVAEGVANRTGHSEQLLVIDDRACIGHNGGGHRGKASHQRRAVPSSEAEVELFVVHALSSSLGSATVPPYRTRRDWTARQFAICAKPWR